MGSYLKREWPTFKDIRESGLEPKDAKDFSGADTGMTVASGKNEPPLSPIRESADRTHSPGANLGAELQDLAKLAAAVCQKPMALLSLVDGDGQALTSLVGFTSEETAHSLVACLNELGHSEPVVVEGAAPDPGFAAGLLKAMGLPLRSLVAMPVAISKAAAARSKAPGDPAIGWLCVFDTNPGQMSAAQLYGLRTLARQAGVAMELEAERRAAAIGYADLARYQSELEAANDRLRDLVVTDALTGLRNRRAFEERLAFEFSMARRKRRDLTVVLLDADDFKRVNDLLGHSAGDAVLQKLAQVLQETVRLTDLAVRFGGEEFAVILPENDERGGLLWCGRLQKALASAEWEHQQVTVSMGVAGLTPACIDGSHLVAMADQALYRAKRQGKDRFVGAGELDLGRSGL